MLRQAKRWACLLTTAAPFDRPAATGPVCLSQRAFYSTYDVTDFLDPPSVGHVLTVELGNGYLHGVGGEPTGER